MARVFRIKDGRAKNAFAPKITLMSVFGRVHHSILIAHKLRAYSQKINPLALKLLTLEPKQIWVPDFAKESGQINPHFVFKFWVTIFSKSLFEKSNTFQSLLNTHFRAFGNIIEFATVTETWLPISQARYKYWLPVSHSHYSLPIFRHFLLC